MSDQRKPDPFWTRLAQQLEQEGNAERAQTAQRGEAPQGEKPDTKHRQQPERGRRHPRMRGGPHS